MLRPFLTGFVALLIAGCAAEAEVIEIPPEPPALELTGRVDDAADILSPAFESKMTATLEGLENDTGVQLVVVTSRDLKGEDIADYTRDLANAWGIGDAERDDGLVILVAPNERSIRIAVGCGLEETVTDEEASNIIQQDILPQFRRGEFEAGVTAGVDRLIDEVAPFELKEAA